MKLRHLIQLTVILTTLLLIISNSPAQNYYKPASTLEDSNITLVGEWPWGQCRAVAVRDNYAFIGNGKLLQVLDISDPSNPLVVSEYYTNGLVKDIKLQDSLAFVCSHGFQIFNIANLNSIYEVGQLDITAAIEVVVSDSFAYVLAQYSPPLVYVVDITNVNVPYIRCVTPTASDRPLDMDVKDRFIYVTGDNWGFLTIIDARNPDWLVHHDQFLNSNAIQIRDTLLYLGRASSLAIYNIANPIEPVFLDSAYCGVISGLREMIVQGNYAYSTNDSGLFVFDITNPSETFVVGHLRTREAASLAIQGNLLHIATVGDYRIVNITNIDSLFHEGQFITCASTQEVIVRNKLVYMAASGSGLLILDVSNPIVPQKIGECSTHDKPASHVNVIGTYAYVGAQGLWTMDISDSSAPYVTDYMPSSISWSGVIHANEERVYLLDSVLTIFDRADPAHPLKLAEYPVPDPSIQLATKDSLLYLVAQDGPTHKLIIYNVKDPYNIYELAREDIHATGILINDTIAYVADDVGLTIMSTNSPDFTILSSIETPGSRGQNVQLALFDKYLYMSYGTLLTIDITDPRDPKIVGRAGGSGSIAAKNEYIYQSNEWFLIFKNDLITSVENHDQLVNEFRLYQNYPNPYNPTTQINYTLPRAVDVKLTIYDLLGREISTLVSERKQAGEYKITWNAEGVPSGVYFYRIVAGDFIETKKMVVIR